MRLKIKPILLILTSIRFYFYFLFGCSNLRHLSNGKPWQPHDILVLEPMIDRTNLIEKPSEPSIFSPFNSFKADVLLKMPS